MFPPYSVHGQHVVMWAPGLPAHSRRRGWVWSGKTGSMHARNLSTSELENEKDKLGSMELNSSEKRAGRGWQIIPTVTTTE